MGLRGVYDDKAMYDDDGQPSIMFMLDVQERGGANHASGRSMMIGTMHSSLAQKVHTGNE